MTGDLGQVVEDFYEAALRPELWRATLHRMSLALNADGAVLLTFPDPRGGTYNSEGIDELMDAFTRASQRGAFRQGILVDQVERASSPISDCRPHADGNCSEDVSKDTVSTQLNSIFRKTDVSRQAELVALTLLSLI